MSDTGRGLAAMAGKIYSMITRGTLSLLDTARKMQVAQVRLLAGETKDGLEVFEQYGFTSAANLGAEVISLFLDGDRSNGIVICVADRRFRLMVNPGEVAVYDDLGQKVHLTRSGIVIDGAGLPILIENVPTATVKADAKINLDTPLVECTGNLTVIGGMNVLGTGDTGGTSHITGDFEIVGSTLTHNGKNIGSTHTHSGVQSGSGNTGAPV